MKITPKRLVCALAVLAFVPLSLAVAAEAAPAPCPGTHGQRHGGGRRRSDRPGDD